MSNTNFSLKKAVFVLLMVISVLLMPLTTLADEPRVYLHQIESGESSMTVEVKAEGMTDLYGMEFRLNYDPTVLTVKDAAPDEEGVQIALGEMLPAEQGFVVANQADADEGTITIAMTLLNPATGVNGAGTLATIQFDLLSSQASNLDFELLNLVSSETQPIASQTEGLSFGSGGGESGSMLWLVIAGGAVVGVLLIGVGGFIMMGQSKKTSSENGPDETPQVNGKVATANK